MRAIQIITITYYSIIAILVCLLIYLVTLKVGPLNSGLQ